MPEMRTDDGPRKLRAVWLGPKGATLPFEWSYVQWAVTLALIPAGVLVVAGLIAVAGVATIGHPPWFTFWIGIIYGGPAGIYGAVWLMRGVTFDQPLRYKLATFREEFGWSARSAAEKPINWQMPFPTIVGAAGLPDVQAKRQESEPTTAPGQSR